MHRILVVFALLVAACAPSAEPSTTTAPPVTTTTTTTPAGPGACGTPLLIDERIPDTPTAEEIVRRFLDDRRNGVGAEGCLTADAQTAFASSTFPLCLYECADLAKMNLPESPKIEDVSETSVGRLLAVTVDYQVEDVSHRRIREMYQVITVRAQDDRRQVLIGTVTTEPDSEIADVDARRVVDDLLAALADSAWDAAGALLLTDVNYEVAGRVPSVTTAPFDETLPAFCEESLCAAPYEILSTSATDDPRVRSVRIRFEDAEGPIEYDLPVVGTEAGLLVGDIPPAGKPSGSPPRVVDVLFPDGYDGTVGLLRYQGLELAGRNESSWQVWPGAHGIDTGTLIDSTILFTALGDVRLATFGDGTVSVRKVLAAAPWRLAGGVLLDGEPAVILVDGRRVIAYDLTTQEIRTLVDVGSREETVTCASVASGTVLVTMQLGDRVAYERYTDDGQRLSRLELDRASGCAVLSPDASTFAYVADVSLGNPKTIVLAAVDGLTEVDRWSVVADGIITAMTFDGRYAVAELGVPPRYAAYTLSEDLGRRFVVDTQTGDQWTVDTGVHVIFPTR